MDRREPKVYAKPKQKPNTNLPQHVLDYFAKRGISEETLKKMKIGFKDGWVQFPYFKNSELVNVKYRKLSTKQFRLEKDAEQIFFNRDMALECPGQVIVVEGEIDVLSLVETGITNVVSVPAGAPSKPGEFKAKFEFLENDEEFVSSIKHWIQATDSDGPGTVLRDELARRLGKEKCLIIEWPEGCKDANDVLIKHGAEKLIKQIGMAKPYPIYGIVEPIQLQESLQYAYEHGFKKGVSTGWKSHDEFYTVRPGEFTVMTGIPGHGKTEWLDALMINLAKEQDWIFAVFSPENFPHEQHAARLIEKYIGAPFNRGFSERLTFEQMNEALQWLQDHFSFISPTEENVNLDSILELARVVVFRNGANGLLIDPWNEIDHSRPEGLTETEYISNCLKRIRRFARMNDVHVWLVSHPTKMKKNDEGCYPVPTPYDISGSAHWRNRADNCLSIYRSMNGKDVPVQIHIQKVRFKQVGKVGMVELNYDEVTGCYSEKA
jgi:twinkle protein